MWHLLQDHSFCQSSDAVGVECTVNHSWPHCCSLPGQGPGRGPRVILMSAKHGMLFAVWLMSLDTATPFFSPHLLRRASHVAVEVADLRSTWGDSRMEAGIPMSTRGWKVYAADREGGDFVDEPERKTGGKSSKRRSRKRKGTRSEADGQPEGAGMPRSAEEVADSKIRRLQEDVIKRDIDGDLRIEEFADPRGRSQGVTGEEGAGPSLKYDPTFELPIPSETMMSLSDMGLGAMDGAIQKDQNLPSLAELGKSKSKGSVLKRQKQEEEESMKELEPIDDYSLSSGILGEGRPVMGIGLPYLQSCHTVWLLVALLCAFVEFPGFPLTNLPLEIRDFLKQGLLVVYAINTVLAINSVGAAADRGQSVPFWTLKCFVLGALAHNELLLIRKKGEQATI